MIIEIEDDIGATYKFDLDDSKPVNICSCDVDGTLSAGVFYLDNGRIARRYFMRDGAGLRNLVRIPNTVVLLISGESDQSIWDRALKLQIPFLHAPGRNKVPRYTEFLTAFSDYEVRMFHIGDDVNDLELMKVSTRPYCPSDAHQDILQYVRKNGWVLQSRGGYGAVREWADIICDGFAFANAGGGSV